MAGGRPSAGQVPQGLGPFVILRLQRFRFGPRVAARRIAASRPLPAAGRFGRVGSPDLADRAIFLSLPHNQEALPVELRGARASMACQHPTTPRGSAAVLSRNRAKSPERAFCPAGHFLHAYRANRRSAIEKVVDADEVAARIQDMMAERRRVEGQCNGALARRGRAGTRIIRMGKPVQRQQPLRPLVATARTSLKKLLSEGFEKTSRNPTGLALSRVRH
jgi:hypothetical protein